MCIDLEELKPVKNYTFDRLLEMLRFFKLNIVWFKKK